MLVPWHQHTLVGIPTFPRQRWNLFLERGDRIHSHDRDSTKQGPDPRDVLVFVGIRPLVKAGGGSNTAALSRDHTIHIDSSGLLSVAGGKWTTYRNMAEDCLDQAATLARLPEKPCITRSLNIHGYHQHAEQFGPLAIYGGDASDIQNLIQADPSLGAPLHSALPYCGAEVVWATRFEMARMVEDVLARRTRALFLNARAAIEMAPRVATLMAQELQRDKAWEIDQVKAF